MPTLRSSVQSARDRLLAVMDFWPDDGSLNLVYAKLNSALNDLDNYLANMDHVEEEMEGAAHYGPDDDDGDGPRPPLNEDDLRLSDR